MSATVAIRITSAHSMQQTSDNIIQDVIMELRCLRKWKSHKCYFNFINTTNNALISLVQYQERHPATVSKSQRFLLKIYKEPPPNLMASITNNIARQNAN